MEASVVIGVIQTLGISTAILIAIGWFVVYRAWPFYCDQQAKTQKSQDESRAAIVKAVQNNSEMTMSLVQSMVSLRGTLDAMAQSLNDLHEDLADIREDISALYERTGTPRPTHPPKPTRKT